MVVLHVAQPPPPLFSCYCCGQGTLGVGDGHQQGPTGRGFLLRDGTGRVLAKKIGYRDGSGRVVGKI